MATRNIAENKRFVSRSSEKKPTTYVLNGNGSKSHNSSKISHTQSKSIAGMSQSPPSSSSSQTFANNEKSRTKVTPARRVVVIRNTKHAQLDQGPVDLGDFGKTNSEKIPPVINNGHTSVYFIRRPIPPSEQLESIE